MLSYGFGTRLGLSYWRLHPCVSIEEFNRIPVLTPYTPLKLDSAVMTQSAFGCFYPQGQPWDSHYVRKILTIYWSLRTEL